MQLAAVLSGAIIIQLCVVALQRRLDIGRRSEKGCSSSCANTHSAVLLWLTAAAVAALPRVTTDLRVH
eukprot:9199-Heterococcus_DN1.PRE.3